MKFKDARGFVREAPLPDEALPVCETCPKPDLEPGHLDAVILWNRVRDQVIYNTNDGNILGLRMEAVVAVAKWMHEAGRIDDIDAAIDGVDILADVSFRLHNQRQNAHNALERQKSESKKA